MSWFKRDKGDDDKLPKLDDKDRKVRTEGLWQKCEGCRQIIWKKDLETNWNVCPKCGAHSRIDAVTRLNLLLDDGKYTRHDTELRSSDPLGFVDSKPYSERLKSMQQATKLGDAMIAAEGRLCGRPVQVCAMEPKFIGGSMGSVVTIANPDDPSFGQVSSPVTDVTGAYTFGSVPLGVSYRFRVTYGGMDFIPADGSGRSEEHTSEI